MNKRMKSANSISLLLLISILIFSGCATHIKINDSDLSTLQKPKTDIKKDSKKLCIIYDEKASAKLLIPGPYSIENFIGYKNIIQKVGTYYFEDIYNTETIELSDIMDASCDLMIFTDVTEIIYKTDNKPSTMANVMYSSTNKIFIEKQLYKKIPLQKKYELPQSLDSKQIAVEIVYDIMNELNAYLK